MKGFARFSQRFNRKIILLCNRKRKHKNAVNVEEVSLKVSLERTGNMKRLVWYSQVLILCPPISCWQGCELRPPVVPSEILNPHRGSQGCHDLLPQADTEVSLNGFLRT